MELLAAASSSITWASVIQGMILIIAGIFIGAIASAVKNSVTFGTRVGKLESNTEEFGHLLKVPQQIEHLESKITEAIGMMRAHIDGPGHGKTITELAVQDEKMKDMKDDIERAWAHIRAVESKERKTT